MKEFHFWLFSDQLIYGEATPLGRFTINRQIYLSKCFVHDDGCGSIENSFVVESPAKSFLVKAK